MAQTATPYGLYVRKCIGARRNTAGNTHYPVPANVTGAMYYGAPVTQATGGAVLGPMAASPSSAAPVIGVVQGAQWISPLKPEWFPALPAGTYAAGGKNISVMVNDDPGLIMMVQATATVVLADVGKVAALVNFAAGNNSTGRSICALNAATMAATGDLAVKIVGVLDPGAPFPDVLVAWNTGVHINRTSASSFEGVAPDAVDPEEQNAIFEEFVFARMNEIREEAGLPPLPTPEEREKEREKKLEETKKKQEEFNKRVEQRLAERKKAQQKPASGVRHPEPVVAGKEKK